MASSRRPSSDRTGADPWARLRSPPWQRTTLEAKKSRIKELFKNCIVGEAPARRKAELQSAVPGAAPKSPVVWNQLPPRLPGVRDARPKTARTHTCAHTHSLTHAHTRTRSLPSSRRLVELEEVRPRTEQKASPFGFTGSRTSGTEETETKQNKTIISAAAHAAASSIPLMFSTYTIYRRVPHTHGEKHSLATSQGAHLHSQHPDQEAERGQVPIAPPPTPRPP